jgi:hypothetical protein
MQQAKVRCKGGNRAGIAGLRREREQLEEEVRQLRAAIQMYAEVVRRLQTLTAPEPDRSAPRAA